MRTYVLTLARQFPSYHSKAGQPTDFFSKIEDGLKLHTIRENYELWKRRIDNVNDGTAVLSLREWTGRPYNSVQHELKRLTNVGIQKLELTMLGWFIDDIESDYTSKDIALRDGLSYENFKEWFKQTAMQPMAIIHFSEFRYNHA